MSFVKDYACPLPVLFTGFSRLLLSRITPVLYRFSVFGFRTGFRLPNRKVHHQNRVVSRPRAITRAGIHPQILLRRPFSFLFFPLKDYACPFFLSFFFHSRIMPVLSFFFLSFFFHSRIMPVLSFLSFLLSITRIMPVLSSLLGLCLSFLLFLSIMPVLSFFPFFLSAL